MNIAEIARMAGVSSAAVSRYFNNGYISEEKKQAIQKVVEETGYRPSVQAQMLRTKKTKMIGVIVPRVASAAVGSVVEGILSVLNQSGYQMLLAVTQNDPDKELEYLSAFDEKQVDGILLSATVFTSEHRRLLKKVTIPVVIIGQQFPGSCCVYHDDYQACYDLTTHFLENGRERLAYIGAIRQDKAVGEQRSRGYQDAVCDKGLDELAQRCVVAGFSSESGYEKMKELLERYPDLDGVVCAADEMAVGALQYLKEQRISVPEQIAVAGHGDSDIVCVTSPPLTTVHYSYEKSGELAVRMLLEILEYGKTDMKEIMLGCHLVVREAES